MVTNIEEQLRVTEPAQRVLLLPHCLRRAETCQGKYTKQGLECNECNPDCPANQLRQALTGREWRGDIISPRMFSPELLRAISSAPLFAMLL